MVINEVFQVPETDALAVRGSILEGLQAAVAARVAVLGDAGLTGTGQSSAEVLGVDAQVVARRLAGHLVREIIGRAARGGPLAPLADQLNHDVTHLQGERLAGVLAELTQEVRDALVQAGKSAARPVRLLPRPGLLVGREDLLAELHVRLTRSGGNEPQVAVLCGLGGVGKTSVAVEYAYRHQAGLSVVWQFAAEDPATLAAGFGDLAALLCPGQAGDPIALVHAVLAANELDWLLIFDNVPDALAIRAALPPAGRGRILITSQYPHWLGGWALDIPVLDVDTAARFLLDRTGQVDEGAAADLARELGGLPLALEQAAAYMLASGHAVPTYLDLFLQRRSELLARGDPAGYDRNVATAWDLAFDQLERFTPLAVTLLRLLACCAPELIPVRVLLQPRPGLADQMPPELAALASDVLAMDDAIAALRRFSLISPPLDGAVSVHRLVQATTLAQLSADQHNVWKHAAAALIEAALPAEPEKPLNWPAFAMLLPHAQTAIPPESSAMARIANFLGYSGNYGAARLLQGQIVEGRTGALGTEHRAPSTRIP